MKKTAFALLILLLFSAATGMQIVKVAETSVADSSNVDWWPMFHHDLGHTGYSTSTGPTTNHTIWTFATGGAVETSPAVVDGKVFFGSDDGSIYAVNASSGALIWNYSTEGPVQSSPTVVDGVVYIGGFHSHAVFALNASSGALLWNTPIDSSYPNTISSTAVANGMVYVDVYNVAPSGGKLYALNATTGAIAWTYQPIAWLSSSPAVSNGMVYIGTSTGVVVSLNATSGGIVWLYYLRPDGSNSTSGTYFPIQSSLSVANGLVYLGTTAETVQALNAFSGAFVWSVKIFGGVHSSCIAVSDDMLYVATTMGGTSSDDLRAGGISALNAATGSLSWNRTIGSIGWSSPAVAGEMVYVGSDPSFPPFNTTIGYEVYALNAITGEVVWTYATGGAIYSSPAIANGVVYVGSSDGKVYAFGNAQNTSSSPAPSAILSAALTAIVACASLGLLFYLVRKKQRKFAG